MKTQKARLLTGDVLAAFNNPLKLAGEIGMLDAISGHPRPSARDPFVWHRRCGVEAPDKKSVGLSPIPCLRWTYVPAIKSYQSGDLGVGIIGSGRIGTLRANMASRHPSVRFLAVSDLDPERAGLLGQCVNADFTSSDNLRVISHPEVNTVIVSTPEHEHTLPILQALDLGKPVFVEKPLALTLDEADQIVAAVEKSGVELRIGYSRRHDRKVDAGQRADCSTTPGRHPRYTIPSLQYPSPHDGDPETFPRSDTGTGRPDLLCRHGRVPSSQSCLESKG